MMIDFDKSWTLAEEICFDTFRVGYTGGVEGQTCFRGYLPQGAPNVWMFTSGGDAETQIGRLQGQNPCFGTIRILAAFVGHFSVSDRDKAQEFASMVLRMLSEKNNLHEIGNVMWLRLTGMQQEPILQTQENGYQYWEITVPLELIYNTTTNYNQ